LVTIFAALCSKPGPMARQCETPSVGPRFAQLEEALGQARNGAGF